jgi:hypothetical protein
MAIERGRDWGEPGRLAAGAASVAGDAEAREIVERTRRAGGARPLPEIGLVAGDLCRTLGGGLRGGRSPVGRVGAGSASPRAALCDRGGTRVTVDVVRARLDGRDHWFVAHLVARRRAWSGRFVVAMNAEWLGEWKAAPRAHPGDGLVDVVDGRLPLRQRLAARRLARTGDHVPHPALTTRRVEELSVRFDRPRRVWLDGVPVGRVTALELVVEPDALTVVV